jgi:hypothetical protein
MEATYSYTEHAAQQRHELGAGLNILDKVRSMIADVTNVTHQRAVRQRVNAGYAQFRRDAREQVLARIEAI